MMMSDGQRKILVDSFLLLAAGARQGKMKSETESAESILAHVDKLEDIIRTIRRGVDGHIGASHAIDLIGARAKTLSSSRRR